MIFSRVLLSFWVPPETFTMSYLTNILLASLTVLSIYRVNGVNPGDPCYLLWIRQHGTCELESNCLANGTSFYSAPCNSRALNPQEKELICCPNEEDKETQPVKRSVSDLFPSSPDCGRTMYDDMLDDRIVGGHEAKPGTWPWLVMLGTKFSDSTISWTCGGTLISKRWIATAAHCYFEAQGALNWTRLGALNIMNPTADSLDMRIKLFILNEKYIKGRFHADIALAKLEEDIDFTDFIRPICLPEKREDREHKFENDIAYVAGWGTTQYNGLPSNDLREAHIDIIDWDVCKAIFKPKKVHIQPNQICAGDLEGKKDACQGDSGGPLAYYDEEQGSSVLIGIVSFGYKCAVKGYPGVYTKVCDYIDWIVDTAKKNKNT